jgi:hypothetical protein
MRSYVTYSTRGEISLLYFISNIPLHVAVFIRMIFLFYIFMVTCKFSSLQMISLNIKRVYKHISFQQQQQQ